MKEELNSELVSALLGLFAHDLRNPLSALHSNVSFLTSVVGGSDSEAREALEDVAASSDALGHITDNLELLATALDGSKPREKLELSLRELLHDVAQKSRRFAESYRVTLEVDLDSAGPMRIVAHREMWLRALANLVRNAIQHAGESGKVSVYAGRHGGEVVVSVLDTGTPVAPALGVTAFTAEGQLFSKNASGGRYSRGLGLYAARVAAEVAGATVGIASSGASCFELRAPAK